MRNARSVNVVITRSAEGNKELSRRLKTAGVNPIPVDAISTAPPRDWSRVDGLLARLGAFDWLVFTSATAAKYFGLRMKALSLRLPWKGKPIVAAVGRQTARTLSRLGVKTEFIPSSYTTATLAEELPTDFGPRVLLLRADVADPSLKRTLGARGFEPFETAIYRTLPGKGPRPRIAHADSIIFASPSAVRGFCRLMPKAELARMKRLMAVCIGPVTEAAAKDRGFSNTIKPKSYTLSAVVREVKRLSHEVG